MLPPQSEWQPQLPRSINQIRRQEHGIQEYQAYARDDRICRAQNAFYNRQIARPTQCMSKEQVMRKI